MATELLLPVRFRPRRRVDTSLRRVRADRNRDRFPRRRGGVGSRQSRRRREAPHAPRARSTPTGALSVRTATGRPSAVPHRRRWFPNGEAAPIRLAVARFSSDLRQWIRSGTPTDERAREPGGSTRGSRSSSVPDGRRFVASERNSPVWPTFRRPSPRQPPSVNSRWESELFPEARLRFPVQCPDSREKF